MRTMTTWIARSNYLQPERTRFVTLVGSDLIEWSDADLLARHVQSIYSVHTTESIRRDLVATVCVEARLDIGQYHPRIWRGEKWSPTLHNDPVGAVRLGFQSVGLLLDRLRAIFRTVQPEEANRRAYGHQMRELLMLAATDVESSWRAILRENQLDPPGPKRWTTREYVRILSPLRLETWSVTMPLYPRYGRITPFAGWNPDEPSGSLPWYSAYNATKHDREGELARADLENVVSAVAAAYVMLLAQVGPHSLSAGEYMPRDFAIEAAPEWPLGETYVPPFRWVPGMVAVSDVPKLSEWSAVPFTFK
jgi:hypothetical protein